MSDTLFDLPDSPSPRLRWLREHGLTLVEVRSGKFECRMTDETFGTGDSGDDACVDFCAKTGLPHWNS